jgi:multiple sugar transport system permease protein
MKDKKISKILRIYIPLGLLLLFILFPYVWTFLTSIKPSTELYTNKIQILPAHPTFENYVQLLGEKKFILGARNSIIVSVSTAFVTLVVALMAAYACSRYNFKGKKYILVAFLLIYMFPPVLLLMPIFVVMKGLGLLNTFTSLVVAYCTFAIPFAIWLLTGFMNDIPEELEEAGIVDGCNRFNAFIRVIFPVMSPGIIAALIYIFIYSWNEFIFANMFTAANTKTIPIFIYSFIGENNIDWGLLTSGGILTGLPIIIMFMFIQKNLVQGLTSGGVKG